MSKIQWTQDNPGDFTGFIGRDEAGNIYAMPGHRETCTCTMPDGSTGYGWTPEDALARAARAKAEKSENKPQTPLHTWHIQEGFTLNLSGEFFTLVYGDEFVGFHIDEIDDVISALERAKSHIQAEKIKAEEMTALARWGKERIPTEGV